MKIKIPCIHCDGESIEVGSDVHQNYQYRCIKCMCDAWYNKHHHKEVVRDMRNNKIDELLNEQD